MISGGWYCHREANNAKYNPDLFKDAIKKKDMIPDGLNRQRKASNNHQNPGSGKGRNGFWWMKLSEGVHTHYVPGPVKDAMEEKI